MIESFLFRGSTASATAPSILFDDFQKTVAGSLGLPVPMVFVVQGFGAAAGSIICSGKGRSLDKNIVVKK